MSECVVNIMTKTGVGFELKITEKQKDFILSQWNDSDTRLIHCGESLRVKSSEIIAIQTREMGMIAAPPGPKLAIPGVN